MGGHSRRFLSGFLAALAVTAALTPAVSASPPPFVLRDGVSQPIYSYQQAIRETAWVETGTDNDHDGKIDRVAADIIRPSEPAARGQRVPVIMDVSPYYTCCGRGNERQVKTYAPDGTPEQFPLFYDNYFVPRGYAVVLVDFGGTNRSSGCFDEVGAGVSVVNWLNGRVKGFSTLDGQHAVKASWANGSVGAIGKSQDGAAAIGLAVSGVPGLKTAVPIAGVSSYYQVHNSDGAAFGPLDTSPYPFYTAHAKEVCAAYDAAGAIRLGANGDYNEFWQQANYAANVDRVRASVFAVHGFFDPAVQPKQFALWWDALGRAGVTRKAWLHQAGHVDPFDLQRGLWVSTLHRWFDRFLLGVPNGVEYEPAIHLETTADHWTDTRQWPPGTSPRTLSPAPDGTLSARPSHGAATVIDDPTLSRLNWAENPGQPSPARVVFSTAALPKATRFAGSPSVTVTARSDKPVARVGAVVVDYGPAAVRDTENSPGIKDLTTRSCWGESSAVDSACYLDTATNLATVDHQIVAVGWADLGHYRSLEHGVPLTPGTAYTMTFVLNPLDHIVPAGHRLALILGGTDGGTDCQNNFCQFDEALPRLNDTLTFELAHTSVTLPQVR